jgi:hypothetical protein
MMPVGYPSVLVLETSSICNRVCPTCIRNSNPDKEAMRSWFDPNFMSMDVINEVIRQYKEQGFTSRVCLCFYNEPLMDPRIVDIAMLFKEGGVEHVYLVTNGDFLTKCLAKQLDGLLSRITVSLYYDRKIRNKKKNGIRSMFKKTKVWIKGQHINNHYNGVPLKNAECKSQRISTRLIINHRQQYLMCCDDLTGMFDLGTFPEISLKDFWFGEKRTKIRNDLLVPGGRNKYEYCSICPRIW